MSSHPKRDVSAAYPHLTPALSAPRGREGERAAPPAFPLRLWGRGTGGGGVFGALAGSCGTSYRIVLRPLARVAEFGRRNGLKIRWPSGRPGSSPGAGTNKINVLGDFLGESDRRGLCSCRHHVGKPPPESETAPQGADHDTWFRTEDEARSVRRLGGIGGVVHGASSRREYVRRERRLVPALCQLQANEPVRGVGGS